MDMEIMRLANVSPLQAPDRCARVLRTVAWSANGSLTQWGRAAPTAPQRVPDLDWPRSLFDDEVSFH
jgi:hypothetical protein